MTNSPDAESWIGKIPLLSSDEIPAYVPRCEFPANFVKEFSTNYISAIKNLLEKSGHEKIGSISDLGKLLFFCPGISFNSITSFFISNPANTYSLFSSYFSSMNYDYLDIADAARLALSRVSFPENISVIQIILNAFAEVYWCSNKSIPVCQKDVARLAKASLLFSMRKHKNESMSRDEFLTLVYNVETTKEIKKGFYDNIRKSPIPLFFTFLDPKVEPEMNKVGYLTRLSGMFKRKNRLLYSLVQDEIQFFKDQTSKELAGGIELENTVTTFVPTTAKIQAHLEIQRIDGTPFGYSLSKGQRKKSKKVKHSLFSTNEQDLPPWISMINFNAVYSSLYKTDIW